MRGEGRKGGEGRGEGKPLIKNSSGIYMYSGLITTSLGGGRAA